MSAPVAAGRGTTDHQGSALAVGVCFTLIGVSMTAALSRMPSIREQVGATSAELSLALVCVGIGSLITMPFTGMLVERFSSAVVLRTFGTTFMLAWTAIAFAPSVPVLAIFMLVVGMGMGVSDVSMNVQGHTVEVKQRRVLMPTLHAVFSFGSVAGALIGAGFARLDLSVKVQFPIIAVLSVIVLFWCSRYFASDRVEKPDPAAAVDENVPPRKGITRLEIMLGIIVLATAMGEGAANDWLALMLVDTRGVPESFGALALAGFNLTMGIGRLIGGQMIARMGRVPVLRVSGGLASFGVLLLCLVDSPVTALIGAGCWGLGLAVVFPSGMSAAGEVPGRGARAIAVVSTIGYAGFLLGAPLIGQLTHVLPLDRALLVVAGVVLLVFLLAPAARERGEHARITVTGSKPATDPGH